MNFDILIIINNLWLADKATFMHPAAIIENMDLIIRDTSVASLAGAMQQTYWILLPYESGLRWGIETAF